MALKSLYLVGRTNEQREIITVCLLLGIYAFCFPSEDAAILNAISLGYFAFVSYLIGKTYKIRGSLERNGAFLDNLRVLVRELGYKEFLLAVVSGIFFGLGAYSGTVEMSNRIGLSGAILINLRPALVDAFKTLCMKWCIRFRR